MWFDWSFKRRFRSEVSVWVPSDVRPIHLVACAPLFFCYSHQEYDSLQCCRTILALAAEPSLACEAYRSAAKEGRPPHESCWCFFFSCRVTRSGSNLGLGMIGTLLETVHRLHRVITSPPPMVCCQKMRALIQFAMVAGKIAEWDSHKAN